MNIRSLMLGAAALTAIGAAAQANYTVTVPLTDDEDGLTAYITNFDTGAPIDSTIVEGGKAVFTGTTAQPVMARVMLDGNRAGMLILEGGDITVGGPRRIGSGSPVNDAFTALLNSQDELVREFRALPSPDDPRGKEIQNKYEQASQDALNANINNPLGYYLFLQECYNWDLPTFDAKLAEYPQFAAYNKVRTLRQGLVNKQETQPGKMFKDFEVTYNGKTQRLSDYVGKGRYVLADFWASWCGPCIRETKVLKELNSKYGPEGTNQLDVLGVAVWDEPQNTLRAIEQHQLPWQQILDTQTVATDIYGIPAIPCIILFDPEGRIVSRDKQDAELVADVDAAMQQAAAK